MTFKDKEVRLKNKRLNKVRKIIKEQLRKYTTDSILVTD